VPFSRWPHQHQYSVLDSRQKRLHLPGALRRLTSVCLLLAFCSPPPGHVSTLFLYARRYCLLVSQSLRSSLLDITFPFHLFCLPIKPLCLLAQTALPIVYILCLHEQTTCILEYIFVLLNKRFAFLRIRFAFLHIRLIFFPTVTCIIALLLIIFFYIVLITDDTSLFSPHQFDFP
jgi:hypothetical protein